MTHTTIMILEEVPTPSDPDSPTCEIERLKMQLDAPPSPAVLQQIIALLTQPGPVKRKRRSDAGTKREGPKP